MTLSFKSVKSAFCYVEENFLPRGALYEFPEGDLDSPGCFNRAFNWPNFKDLLRLVREPPASSFDGTGLFVFFFLNSLFFDLFALLATQELVDLFILI